MKCACLALLVFLGIGFSQPKPSKPSFEVAVIRPVNANDAIFVPMSADPTVVSYGNINLRDALRGAFRMRAFQIVTPDWIATARFDIQGKLPEGATPDQAPEMLQSLLEERFKMETRRETRDTDVYALLAAPGGHKLKPTDMTNYAKGPMAMGTDGKPRQAVGFGGNTASVTIMAPGASLLTFVGVTSRFTARPLVDLTGIDGLYDFNITFVPEIRDILAEAPPNAETAPILAVALKPYGLRIEKRKMPLEYLIVVRSERTPTEN